MEQNLRWGRLPRNGEIVSVWHSGKKCTFIIVFVGNFSPEKLPSWTNGAPDMLLLCPSLTTILPPSTPLSFPKMMLSRQSQHLSLWNYQ